MMLLRLKPGVRVVLTTILLLLLLGAGPRQAPLELPDISKRINAFTIDLLKHNTGATNIPSNTILSPQSIYHGLAMSYVASDGDTRRELAQALHFPDDNEQLLKGLADLRNQLHQAARGRRIDMTIANSLWLDETYADFQNKYVDEVEGAFDASLHRVKFAQRERASSDINSWISEKTHGKIGNCVSPDDFASRTRPGVVDEPALVSVNTVYFKADWGSQFDEASSSKRAFQIDASSAADTLMMHQRSLLPYSANDHLQFLEIPYINGGYSMFVILPKEIMSIQELMTVVTADMILDLKQKAFGHQVDVLLPKFEMKSHLAVKDTLLEMGVELAFNDQKADFDKMIIKKVEAFRAYVSEVYHAAWIDVHEEGTKAAAATTTTHSSIGCSAPRQLMPAEFHADHPFLFMIVHNQSRSILFAGWISNPEALMQ